MTKRRYNAGFLFLLSIHDRKAYFFVGDSEDVVMPVTARELSSFEAFRAKAFDTFGLWCFNHDGDGDTLRPHTPVEWHHEVIQAANREPPTNA